MSAVNQRDQRDELEFGAIEAALRGEFAARAESLADAPAPYPAVRQAVRRDHTRRLAGAASGLVLVLVAGLVATLTLTGWSGSSADAAASAPSSLLTIPTRGNLAGDSAFLAAVKLRLDTMPSQSAHSPDVPGGAGASSGYTILYANDDGTHRVVIAGSYDGQYTMFTPLVGDHGASASALTGGNASGSRDPAYFTYLGTFAADGSSAPFAVLGPTNMTSVEYAKAVTLVAKGGVLSVVHSQVTPLEVVDGTAAGEIPGAGTLAAAAQSTLFTSVRAKIGGHLVDVSPSGTGFQAPPGVKPLGPDVQPVTDAVAQAGRAAGLTMNSSSPGGDAVPDNVAQVFYDLALFDSVQIKAITYHVDWIGRETAQWDAALLDIHAPGLPPMQIFVRGLTAGAPDGASPGLANTFVRPAVALTPGHVPHTAAQFGGKPEPELFGYQAMTTW